VLSLTGDRDQAEELTQETFYRAYLHIGSFRGDSSLYTWLCQIARNLYLDAVKRVSRERRSSQQQRMQQKELNAAPQSRGDFAAELVIREKAITLHRVLHRMPEPYKEVFALRVFGELKFREIAELFGRTGADLSISPPERDRQAVKIIQRLRRRRLLWILLVLVVIVPVSWLGLNEIAGEGLSYSNSYDHYQAARFFAELEQGNIASAFDYLNMEQAYADLQQDLSREQGLSEAQRDIYEGMTYEAFVAYNRERFVQGMEEFTRRGYQLQREGGIWARREVVENPLTGQRQTVYSYQTDIRLTDKHGTERSAQMSLHTYPDSAAPHSFLIGGYIASDEGDLIGVLARQMDYWDWGK
jgi:RNA polymerase sigma-70 factor, ECF subfamily